MSERSVINRPFWSPIDTIDLLIIAGRRTGGPVNR
jgi:hypothetical protein